MPRIIVRRPSSNLWAIVQWKGVEGSQFLTALRSAMTEWLQTPQGQEAWRTPDLKFTLSDLYVYHPRGTVDANGLLGALWRKGIRELEIDVGLGIEDWYDSDLREG